MGLSVGQREALADPTPSSFEGVMGGAGTVSKPSKVINVDDLVFDGLDGQESTAGGPDAASINSSMGTGVALAASGGNLYLQNPVPSIQKPWLHNQQLPSVVLKHEKVEHRIMLYLKAQGKSNREVAEYMGYSDAQVSQIVRQRWFVSDLRELLESEGQDLVRKMLQGAAVDSIITLIELRDDTKAPAAVRAQCSNSLLDRLLGKPKQEVSVEKKESPTQRVGAVNEELDVLEARELELKKQLARLAGVFIILLSITGLMGCAGGRAPRPESASAYGKTYARTNADDSDETGAEVGVKLTFFPK